MGSMTAPSGCLVALGSSGSPVVFFKFCLNWLRSVLTVWLLMEMPSSVCCSRFSMALRELVTLLFSASSWLDRSLLAALASSQARLTSVCRVPISSLSSCSVSLVYSSVLLGSIWPTMPPPSLRA